MKKACASKKEQRGRFAKTDGAPRGSSPRGGPRAYIERAPLQGDG